MPATTSSNTHEASSSTSTTSHQEQQSLIVECRICREATQPLINPCHCAAPVHPKCLETWLQQRQVFFPLRATKPSCEVCLGPYVNHNSDANNEDGESWWRKSGNGGFLTNVLGRTMIGISVEGCLLMCVFVLGVAGHGIYLLWMYGDGWAGRVEAYVIERFALGVVNAVLTAAFLYLFKKAVTKWISSMESDILEAESWKLMPVIAGIVLSLVAAFEVYMILSLAGL